MVRISCALELQVDNARAFRVVLAEPFYRSSERIYGQFEIVCCSIGELPKILPREDAVFAAVNAICAQTRIKN